MLPPYCNVVRIERRVEEKKEKKGKKKHARRAYKIDNSNIRIRIFKMRQPFILAENIQSLTNDGNDRHNYKKPKPNITLE